MLHERIVGGASEKDFRFSRDRDDRVARKTTRYLSRKRTTLPDFIATDHQLEGRAEAISRTLSQAGSPDEPDSTHNLPNWPFQEN
jgi:hypothetical protein